MSLLQGKRILVVEDEPIIAFALEDTLLGLECDEVRVVTRVPHAMSAVTNEVFDAAVLDVNIHGEQSYGIASELERRGVPFIFATGYGDSVHPPKFQASPTLMKPYSSTDVERCLSLAIAERRGQAHRSTEAAYH